MHQVLGVWDNNCSGAQTFLSANLPATRASAAMSSAALSCFLQNGGSLYLFPFCMYKAQQAGPAHCSLQSRLRQYTICVNDLQVSCSWGFTTTGGAKGVGESTTSAVVISLVLIFIADFILSFLFFQGQGDALKQCM